MSRRNYGGEGQEKRKTGWYKGLHHIIPSSRGGSENRQNMYPKERWGKKYKQKHDAYHILFVNLLPEEVIGKIREYCGEDGKINEEFFFTIFDLDARKDKRRTNRGPGKRKTAWKVVFGDMNGTEAIEWIEREFIQKEWLEDKSS